MINKIGIIGAGQMGNGIAHVASLAGIDVVLTDVDQAQIAKALEAMERNMVRQINRGKITDDEKVAAQARIATAEGYGAFGDCDLVIEAAVENEEVKRAIFKELCPHLGDNTIIATNTSSISVTRLGASTDRPERFMGMHFMNPVPMMQLVELIQIKLTTART